MNIKRKDDGTILISYNNKEIFKCEQYLDSRAKIRIGKTNIFLPVECKNKFFVLELKQINDYIPDKDVIGKNGGTGTIYRTKCMGCEKITHSTRKFTNVFCSKCLKEKSQARAAKRKEQRLEKYNVEESIYGDEK